VVSIFDENGNFISNSGNKMGGGPHDYYTFMGFSYNHILNGIDILTPYHLINYDLNFNFINKTNLPAWPKTSEKKLSQFFASSYAVNENESIILPATASENPFRIIIYNTEEERIVKEMDYSDDIVAGINAQITNLYPLNDSLICFSPQALSYVHYIIHKKTLSLEKTFKIDFGKQNIKPSDLNKYETDKEKNDYLFLESEAPLPLRTFFNNEYIVSTIKIKNEYYTYLNLRKTNTVYLFNNRGKHKTPVFDCLNNNILYAAIQPYELKDYVDLSLLDEKSKKIIENTGDDDNPVIVKYYLK
ncbi:MAG: hypothetical protein LBK58_06380, partial [Prevotellaceae bacterium]|nr:hypothetical protein [Prevotellaceae bacterium]